MAGQRSVIVGSPCSNSSWRCLQRKVDAALLSARQVRHGKVSSLLSTPTVSSTADPLLMCAWTLQGPVITFKVPGLAQTS